MFMNVLMEGLEFLRDHWRDAVEIFILAILVYNGYIYFRATRASRILTGLLLVIIGLTLLSAALQLDVIEWLLKSLSVFLAVALVVIFQPELRRGLAELGSHYFWSAFATQRRDTAEDLVEYSEMLSKRRFGALIAIEREISLRQYLETGVELDAKLGPELLLAIFHPKGALHDGGIIVHLDDERIVGGGCVFPVSQKELNDRTIGLRHRAGLGITEETDAVCIVVSEETGHLSIAHDGELERNLEPDDFRQRLYELLLPSGAVPESESADSARLESEADVAGDRGSRMGHH